MSNVAVFRADASFEIGGGHVYRCLTLADALKMAGWKCYFACSLQTRSVVPAIERSGYVIIDVDSAGSIAQLRQQFGDGIGLMIVDHYELDAEFERACYPWADRVFVISDGGDRRHFCDYLLDQNLKADKERYSGLISPGCRLLLGPGFALLRPQFASTRLAALSRRSTPRNPKTLFISVGAVDHLSLASLVVSSAKDLAVDIDVVLGANDDQRDAIPRLANRREHEVRVHSGVTDMATLMASADIAFGASGSTSWERCCLGLPSVLVVLSENQKMIASALHDSGAAINLGDIALLSASLIKTTLQLLINDNSLCLQMAERAALICDGEGANRVVEELLNA